MITGEWRRYQVPIAAPRRYLDGGHEIPAIDATPALVHFYAMRSRSGAVHVRQELTGHDLEVVLAEDLVVSCAKGLGYLLAIAALYEECSDNELRREAHIEREWNRDYCEYCE